MKFICIGLLLAATIGSGLNAQPKVSVSYQPPIIPLLLKWSPNYGWSVSLSTSFGGLLGTFTADLEISEARNKFPNHRLLFIKVGPKIFVYETKDKPFSLELPRNVKDKIIVTYDGIDIIINIPHPESILAPRPQVIKNSSKGGQTESRTIGKFRITIEKESRDIITRVLHPHTAGRDISFWERAKIDFQALWGAKGKLDVCADKKGAIMQIGQGPFAQTIKLPARVEVRAGLCNIFIIKDGKIINSANVTVMPDETIFLNFQIP